jgi:ferric-dicitrate binding protein FerR (iron transport regulator)
MDEVIAKYLAGEASQEEAAQVERWARVNEGNRKYLEHLTFIFEKASAVKDLHHFDEDAAWRKMKDKLRAKEAKTININREPKKDSTGLQFYLKIAASIIVVMGLGYYVYQRDNSAVSRVEVVAGTKSIADTLPDGSDVFLNKKTKLVYAYDRKKKSHVVKLKGEAFFTIRHNNKKDFLVETEGIYIRDIGTSFNVKAYPGSTTIEVVVKEGAVEFFTDTDSGVYLQAGGKGVYDKVTRKFTVEEPESNALSYKTKFFSFNNQDLESVANDLNTVYDKTIVVDEKLKKCRLTVTFNDESVEEIANVIAATFNLSVKEEAGKLRLEGPGCE